jgi:hypothetical protein
MSTKKLQPNRKAQGPDQRDTLDLDAETVRDLEPGAQSAEQVRGGGTTGSQYCATAGGHG